MIKQRIDFSPSPGDFSISFYKWLNLGGPIKDPWAIRRSSDSDVDGTPDLWTGSNKIYSSQSYTKFKIDYTH